MPELEPVSTLELVVAAKNGGESRRGQILMTEEVTRALETGGHLLVEAGTGTGKSLAYLIPAILHAVKDPSARRRVIISTATKALQEQLFEKDLPFLAQTLADQGVDFNYSILKGRSNYACLAKIADLRSDTKLLSDFSTDELNEVAEWVETTETGDRSEKNFSSNLWSEISVAQGECPGAQSCPFSNGCFAEKARGRAAASDIIVVNTSLYAAHLASGGVVLPEHESVVFDEAHTLEDITAKAFGITMSSARIGRLSALIKKVLKTKTADSMRVEANTLEVELSTFKEESILAFEPPLSLTLERARALSLTAQMELTSAQVDDDKTAALEQARTYNEALLRDLGSFLDETSYVTKVAYVETEGRRPVLKLTPVDVAPTLASTLFKDTTVVATSATLAVGGKFDDPARRFGLNLSLDEPATPARPDWRGGVVPSPFNFQRQGMLYLPKMPSPKADNFLEELTRELDELILSANGRTLMLFTSRRAMNEAAEILMPSAQYEILLQDDMPRGELISAFTSGPGSAIFATQGFWTGIDIPGDALAHVGIDRIPFPRPTDPLLKARRDLAARRGMSAFHTIDIPLAATLLAQGVGRLIRTSADRGVATIFDPRFKTASYAPVLERSLPPMRKTSDAQKVHSALRWINKQNTLV